MPVCTGIWAVAAGLSEDELFDSHQTESAKAITAWCWEVSEAEGLAEGMAAMRWIQTHASYHSVQALEMIHELLGDNPDEPTVN